VRTHADARSALSSCVKPPQRIHRNRTTADDLCKTAPTQRKLARMRKRRQHRTQQREIGNPAAPHGAAPPHCGRKPHTRATPASPLIPPTASRSLHPVRTDFTRQLDVGIGSQPAPRWISSSAAFQRQRVQFIPRIMLLAQLHQPQPVPSARPSSRPQESLPPNSFTLLIAYSGGSSSARRMGHVGGQHRCDLKHSGECCHANSLSLMRMQLAAPLGHAEEMQTHGGMGIGEHAGQPRVSGSGPLCPALRAIRGPVHGRVSRLFRSCRREIPNSPPRFCRGDAGLAGRSHRVSGGRRRRLRRFLCFGWSAQGCISSL